VRKPGVLALVAGFVLAAGFFILPGCGGDEDSAESSLAHVNEKSGSTHGTILDERAGIAPPPGKEVALAKAARQAGCYLLRNVPVEGDRVISPNAPAAEYQSDPPMFGPHVALPHQQADGAYLVSPEVSATVASLNHGRMTIQYAPDLAEDIQLELKGLYDTMYGGTLFFPNNAMNYAIAATTWGNSLDCSGWEGTKTLDAIRLFGKATWGKFGDEPVNKFPVEGPTPANPEESDQADSDAAP
jgi:Protein of unknown function (DUF3105)